MERLLDLELLVLLFMVLAVDKKLVLYGFGSLTSGYASRI